MLLRLFKPNKFVRKTHFVVAKSIFHFHNPLFRNPINYNSYVLYHTSQILLQQGTPIGRIGQEEPKTIDLYTMDLTKRAKEGKLDPVIGRDDEIRRAIQILCRRTKNNPVLIGEPGVGKTVIAEAIAQRIVSGEVPEYMKNKKILSLDLSSLVAGASYHGEFEKRLKKVLEEVENSNGNIILFIDELHTLVGAGSSAGSLDASNMLKPALARGTLSCIGATTLDEFHKYIEGDAAFARRFQPIIIREPNLEDTVTILRGLKDRYEVHHGVQISDSALIAAARLADRYMTERKMPDKAIDLVDEASSRLRLQQDSKPDAIETLDRKTITQKIEIEALKKETDSESIARLTELQNSVKEEELELASLTKQWNEEKSKLTNLKELKRNIEKSKLDLENFQRAGDWNKASEIKFDRLPKLLSALQQQNGNQNHLDMLAERVTEQDIAEVVSRSTGIPVTSLITGEKTFLLQLDSELSRRVIGQEEAIKTIAKCIRISRAGLRVHNRPMGVFMFLGPTGVGKTELAKALTRSLFKTDQALTRIDMSEYMEKFSVSRLIGAPPGYIGYQEGGTLTEAVRRRPYQVILFDEFEKAHHDVSNLFLQVFDEGHLTDSQGHKVDFRNTIMIMTSNLGSGQFGTDYTASKADVIETVRRSFPPEFVNRIDNLIVFKPLSKDAIAGIVDIQLDEIRELLKEKNMRLDITQPSINWLASTAYSPAYGARPLKRAIEEYILDPLSYSIIEGHIKEGDTIKIDLIDKSTLEATENINNGQIEIRSISTEK